MLLWPAGLLAVLSVPVVTSVPAPWPIISIHHQAGLDCNQYYHLLWLPDCSGRKTEQCAERRGEQSRGFGADRPAGYRFEQGRSGDRVEHSPSPPQLLQPKCPRLRCRSERASSLTSLWTTSAGAGNVRERNHRARAYHRPPAPTRGIESALLRCTTLTCYTSMVLGFGVSDETARVHHAARRCGDMTVRRACSPCVPFG